MIFRCDEPDSMKTRLMTPATVTSCPELGGLYTLALLTR